MREIRTKFVSVPYSEEGMDDENAIGQRIVDNLTEGLLQSMKEGESVIKGNKVYYKVEGEFRDSDNSLQKSNIGEG